MLESLRLLIDLQRIDDELSAFEEEHAGLPARREKLEERRSGCEQQLAVSEAGLHDAEADQRRNEQLLQDGEALLQRLEGQQHQVKTNEAYTALLHEMDQARRVVSDCETQILEGMDAAETARAGLERGRVRAADQRQAIEEEEKGISARESTLASRIPEVRERRASLAAQIEPQEVERYEKIAARRKPAVVAVHNEVCDGCRFDIPSQLYIEMLRGERVITCGNCYRILICES